jgi:hypothetical protein
MEREFCLSMLITLVGGITLLGCGWWPIGYRQSSGACALEKIAWRRIWLPVMPALTVAAVLCGWALAEPDPVPEKVPRSLVLMSIPFALLFVRAAVRAGRALVDKKHDPPTATVGLVRPWIVFSPHLAKQLNDRQIEAALEHERAHARHRDPLRIWVGQLATDLQWPWPQARERFRQWLMTLELARDEEAREGGIDGTDLAEAILASTRFGERNNLLMQAALIGEPSALKERIESLLRPLRSAPDRTEAGRYGRFLMLAPALTLAVAAGLVFGERLMRVLFWIAG